MNKLKDSPIFAVALIIMSMLSLVSGASLAKQLFIAIGTESTSVIRLAVAAFFLLIIWRPWRTKLNRGQLKIIATYGICLGVMNFLFYLAIARLPLGIAIAIEFIGPLSVAIYLSRKAFDFLWAILAITGVVLILPISNTQESIDIIGVVYALGAAAAWALYITQGKKAASATHSGVVTSLGMSAGLVAVFPFGATNIPLIFSSSTLIFTAIGVGILSSAIPYSLEMIALKKLASKHFSLLMSMEPAIGAIAGYFYLNEKLSLMQILAIFCIIAASVGSTLMASHTRKVEIINP
jgi:inner membrane transporter RhtA